MTLQYYSLSEHGMDHQSSGFMDFLSVVLVHRMRHRMSDGCSAGGQNLVY